MTNRFVFTDLHGNGEVWNQIKKFIGNQPTVFLGDAADRGTDGFRIIYEMKNMPNLTYLRGNHEELLIEAAREYIRDEVVGEHTCHMQTLPIVLRSLIHARCECLRQRENSTQVVYLLALNKYRNLREIVYQFRLAERLKKVHNPCVWKCISKHRDRHRS